MSSSPFITKARDIAITWARDLLTHPETWVLLDTETTGLGGDAEAVQIAVVAPDGVTLFDELINPYVEIDPDAEAIHRISKAMLADKPRFIEVADLLENTLSGKKIITYNAQFDRRILAQTCKRFDGEFFQQPWGCAMEAYAKFYGEWNDYRRSFRWQKLQGGDHTAGGDCRATLVLIKRMAEARLSTEAEQ